MYFVIYKTILIFIVYYTLFAKFPEKHVIVTTHMHRIKAATFCKYKMYTVFYYFHFEG